MDNGFKKGCIVGVVFGVLGTAAMAFMIFIGASFYMFKSAVSASGPAAANSSEMAQGPAAEIDSKKLNTANIDQKINMIQQYIDKYYIFDDKIDVAEQEDYIMKGFMYGLGDVYSTYYNQDEVKALMEETEGAYCGIGAMVTQSGETGESTVVRVFDNSPAAEAGILPGDIFMEVDGENVLGVDLDLLVSEYVRGEEGTDVNVKMFRPSEQEYKEFTLTRRIVELTMVAGKMIDDEIGYILVAEFDLVTDDQFAEWYKKLTEQGMKKLIIDLRNNPGGELTTLESMADYVLKDGQRVISIKEKSGAEEVYETKDGHEIDIPMVVLVNGHSASAAEAFTGALKDNGAAYVIGTQTFGKGIVQSLLGLPDGSMVKMTTADYYTPSGVCIHGVGITPDEVVELPEEALKYAIIPEELDTQLQAAIEHLR